MDSSIRGGGVAAEVGHASIGLKTLSFTLGLFSQVCCVCGGGGDDADGDDTRAYGCQLK
jgi:hypothetical protein